MGDGKGYRIYFISGTTSTTPITAATTGYIASTNIAIDVNDSGSVSWGSLTAGTWKWHAYLCSNSTWSEQSSVNSFIIQELLESMNIDLFYTSGTSYLNVNGMSKCMRPGPPQRGWYNESSYGPSGCSIGGAIPTDSTLFLPDYGNSGGLLVVYHTNMYFDAPNRRCSSNTAVDLWDISSQEWQGEFKFARSISSQEAGSTYSSTAYLGFIGVPDRSVRLPYCTGLLDVGESWGTYPRCDPSHDYVTALLDENDYVWFSYGGHYGAATNTGWCGLHSVKSSGAYTNPNWCYSGQGMWKFQNAIHATTTGGYPIGFISKCSCHNNWYYICQRQGAVISSWDIKYSKNSGVTWANGVELGENYMSRIFQYVPEINRSLIHCGYYDTYDGPATFWLDCSRMSSMTGGNAGAFSYAVSPSSINNKTIPTYSGAVWHSGDDNTLTSADIITDDAQTGGIAYHPPAIYDYKYNLFWSLENYNQTTKIWLKWKKPGHHSPHTWRSSQIINGGSDTLALVYNPISFVSGNSERLLAFTIRVDDGTNYHPEMIYGTWPYSSASNWHRLKFSTDTNTAGRTLQGPIRSGDGDDSKFLYMRTNWGYGRDTATADTDDSAWITYIDGR